LASKFSGINGRKWANQVTLPGDWQVEDAKVSNGLSVIDGRVNFCSWVQTKWLIGRQSVRISGHWFLPARRSQICSCLRRKLANRLFSFD
jgi:hypothetical protein